MTISVNWVSYQTFHNQDLLKAEKKEIRALMPPPAEESVKKTDQTQIKPRGWLQRLVGAL